MHRSLYKNVIPKPLIYHVRDTSPLNNSPIGQTDLLQKEQRIAEKNTEKYILFLSLILTNAQKRLSTKNYMNSHKTNLQQKNPMSITSVSVYLKQMCFDENTIKTLITIIKSTKLVFIHN